MSAPGATANPCLSDADPAASRAHSAQILASDCNASPARRNGGELCMVQGASISGRRGHLCKRAIAAVCCPVLGGTVVRLRHALLALLPELSIVMVACMSVGILTAHLGSSASASMLMA